MQLVTTSTITQKRQKYTHDIKFSETAVIKHLK